LAVGLFATYFFTSLDLFLCITRSNEFGLRRENMDRRELKKELLATLEQKDLDIITHFLKQHPPHLLLNALFIALNNPIEQVRWHAVWGFGQIVSKVVDKDPESARIVMRRLLWSLNDESGGIGWGAPEALAEIMFHSSVLRQEYLHMLVSYMREDGDEPFQDGNYLELPFLQRGLLWGIGRLCQGHCKEMSARHIIDDILAYLNSPDEQVVGLAIWCLGLLQEDGEKATTKIAEFLDHHVEVQLFVNNKLMTITIAELAKNCLRRRKVAGVSVYGQGA
jgi:hypothetical protein